MNDKETDIDKQLPTEREAHDIRLALAMMDGKGPDVEAEWALMSEKIDRDEADARHRKRRAMLWAAVPLAAAAVAALFAIAGKQPQPTRTPRMEKPRDFDPFGQAGFAHLWLQYD